MDGPDPKWRGSRMGDGQRKGVVEVSSDLVEEEPSYEVENKYKIQNRKVEKQRKKKIIFTSTPTSHSRIFLFLFR